MSGGQQLSSTDSPEASPTLKKAPSMVCSMIGTPLARFSVSAHSLASLLCLSDEGASGTGPAVPKYPTANMSNNDHFIAAREPTSGFLFLFAAVRGYDDSRGAPAQCTAGIACPGAVLPLAAKQAGAESHLQIMPRMCACFA